MRKAYTSNILMLAYTVYHYDPRVKREAEAAVEAGYNVDFIALRSSKQTNILNGVNLIELNQLKHRGDNKLKYIFAYIEFFIRVFFKASFLYFKKSYKVVHVNNMPDFLVFSVLVPKLFGAKLILDIHDPMPIIFLSKYTEAEKGFFYKLLLIQERISCWFSDRVITVHEPSKNDILIGDGIPVDKISVISNFTDEKYFEYNSNYSVSNKIKLVFHGTIAKRFGFDTVIEAIKNYKYRDRITLKVIGDGDYSIRLKEIIAENDLEGIIDFENKMYPVDRLSGLLKEYNAGLVSYELTPGTDYMLPLKMLEYVCLGIPVIAVKNKSIRYYFKDDECFYYDPLNTSSLQAIFDVIIDNPAVLMKYHEKLADVRNRFLWANEKKKYTEILGELSNA